MNARTFAVQFKVPVHAGISADDLAEVERFVPDLVSLVLERRSLRSVADRDLMVEFLLKDIPTKRIDLKRVALEARALEWVYTGTEWLSAEEVGVLGQHAKANPGAAACRWKRSGQLFAIRRDGRDLYPRYALSDDFKPLPVMRKVLDILRGWDGLRVAGWFESTSSFLGGKRPREVVTLDAQRLLDAAHDSVMQLHA
jgi:hypothetical protein